MYTKERFKISLLWDGTWTSFKCVSRVFSVVYGDPYPDGVYTPAWSVHSKATLLPLPLECTLQPHSEYHRCTLGCHSMDLVKSLTNRNTLQCHFKCTPDGVYTPLPLLKLSFCPCIHSNATPWTLNIGSQDSYTSMPLHALKHFHPEKHTLQCHF